MTRSKSKIVYVHRSQFPKFFYNKKKIKLRKKSYRCIIDKKTNIGPYYFFWKRSSTMNKKLLKKRFCIYNGFLFHIIESELDHKGFKLGELSTSRKTAKHKGKQRQKKKVGKSPIKKKLSRYSILLNIERKLDESLKRRNVIKRIRKKQ